MQTTATTPRSKFLFPPVSSSLPFLFSPGPPPLPQYTPDSTAADDLDPRSFLSQNSTQEDFHLQNFNTRTFKLQDLDQHSGTRKADRQSRQNSRTELIQDPDLQAGLPRSCSGTDAVSYNPDATQMPKFIDPAILSLPVD